MRTMLLFVASVFSSSATPFCALEEVCTRFYFVREPSFHKVDENCKNVTRCSATYYFWFSMSRPDGSPWSDAASASDWVDSGDPLPVKLIEMLGPRVSQILSLVPGLENIDFATKHQRIVSSGYATTGATVNGVDPVEKIRSSFWSWVVTIS